MATTQRRICNLVPSKGTESDWTYDDAVAGGMVRARATLPESHDLRATWWKVGDQGFTGSCVGWATADGVGRWLMVESGRIKRTQRLSPRFIWMASKERDEFRDRPTSFVEESGTSLKAAMNVARRYGFAMERALPFEVDTAMFTGRENAFYAAASRRRVAYVNLGLDLQRWKRWLVNKGPILAGLWVDDAWMSLGADGLLDVWGGGAVYGGHAVCIVGYRKDGRFIVRNSWGTGWGHKGFAYVAPSYLHAGFYPESYGATVD
jgi:C1A family cysteine protease